MWRISVGVADCALASGPSQHRMPHWTGLIDLVADRSRLSHEQHRLILDNSKRGGLGIVWRTWHFVNIDV